MKVKLQVEFIVCWVLLIPVIFIDIFSVLCKKKTILPVANYSQDSQCRIKYNSKKKIPVETFLFVTSVFSITILTTRWSWDDQAYIFHFFLLKTISIQQCLPAGICNIENLHCRIFLFLFSSSQYDSYANVSIETNIYFFDQTKSVLNCTDQSTFGSQR